jgi:phenylalanyl-tRNA synthetase alpha chain
VRQAPTIQTRDLTRDRPARIAAAVDLPALEAERVAALGKQGMVTALLKIRRS